MIRNAIGGLALSCLAILLLLLALGFRSRHVVAMFSHPIIGGTAAKVAKPPVIGNSVCFGVALAINYPLMQDIAKEPS